MGIMALPQELRSVRPALRAHTAMVLGFPPLGMGLQQSLEAEAHVQQALNVQEEQHTSPFAPPDRVLLPVAALPVRQDHIVVEDRSPAAVLLDISAFGETQNLIHGLHRVQLAAIAHMVPLWLCPVQLERWEQRAAL